MSKVFIGVGHGGSDSGAYANGVKEKDVNLPIALSANQVLLDHGVTVLLSRYKDEEDSLYEEIAECNNFNPDLAVDIHNNAGKGDGFEAFYHYKGGTSLTLARNIENQVLAIGQNSRGCKTRIGDDGSDYYGFIRETVCPAIIAECAFIDNATDFEILNTALKQQIMGVAIAKGILATLGIPYKEKPTDVVYGDIRRVLVDSKQVGSYRVKNNILNEVSKAIDNNAKKIEINLI